ncbi:MAG: hypothetical protein JWO31_2977, partial [Phycisphaerales bacterium]|nr:hypothetical protein [Phycisphaerales bacterium]
MHALKLAQPFVQAFRRRVAFTFVEVLISVALVLIFILGVN